MEERQSELDELQFHAAAAAIGRSLDRLRPHRSGTGRSARETGRVRRFSGSRRAKGPGLHAHTGRPCGAEKCAESEEWYGVNRLSHPARNADSNRVRLLRLRGGEFALAGGLPLL